MLTECGVYLRRCCILDLNAATRAVAIAQGRRRGGTGNTAECEDSYAAELKTFNRPDTLISTTALMLERAQDKDPEAARASYLKDYGALDSFFDNCYTTQRFFSRPLFFQDRMKSGCMIAHSEGWCRLIVRYKHDIHHTPKDRRKALLQDVTEQVQMEGLPKSGLVFLVLTMAVFGDTDAKGVLYHPKGKDPHKDALSALYDLMHLQESFMQQDLFNQDFARGEDEGLWWADAMNFRPLSFDKALLRLYDKFKLAGYRAFVHWYNDGSFTVKQQVTRADRLFAQS